MKSKTQKRHPRPSGNAKEPSAGKLGAFAGVFTPSALTILGIILFLRLGYVVGAAGTAKAFVIIAMANVISVLTTFSLSAVSTNLKVKGGGVYYLISRTLGVEFGGAIGLVLFLAQAVSIAFYCIGFGEAIAASGIARTDGVSPRIIAAAALAFLFVFAWMGADWATKFQFGVMALLAAEAKPRRMKTGAALRDSQHRFSIIFNKAPFALALTRMPEEVIVDANDGFMQLFEYKHFLPPLRRQRGNRK